MWTKKHDDFSLENKIRPSAQLLWRWLMTEGQPGDRIEIDLLLEFNSWVEKHRPGGGFSAPTLKTALAQLEELGIVVVERSYTWRIHAIVYRALKWIKKQDLDPKPVYENHVPIPQFVSDRIEQQQQEIELREQLISCGIEFRDRDWKKYIAYGIDAVKKSVEHLLERAKSTEINNPPGWLLSCVRNEWWLDRRKWKGFGALMNLAYYGL